MFIIIFIFPLNRSSGGSVRSFEQLQYPSDRIKAAVQSHESGTWQVAQTFGQIVARPPSDALKKWT